MTIDRGGSFRAGGVKARIKWVAPKPADQDWFWGLNFEIGRVAKSLDINPWNAELKGIVGLRRGPWTVAANLNADWVVLSACNTIAGDRPGAEALSGLARAFFYAGARALLVSHWAVDSAAATRLTSSTFEILKSNPRLGRAEALRRAMLGYASDAADPVNAYPAIWAPFSLIGECAAR